MAQNLCPPDLGCGTADAAVSGNPRALGEVHVLNEKIGSMRCKAAKIRWLKFQFKSLKSQSLTCENILGEASSTICTFKMGIRFFQSFMVPSIAREVLIRKYSK